MADTARRANLPDGEARAEATSSRGVNLVVEASAGTGKTHLLVERVVSLASDGVPLDQLAVVTFTDAAAAELRSRIRHGISSMERGEARDDCLRKLPGALIGTIHGFASRILKDYFYLTGVDPAFSAGGQAFPDAELARLWDRYLAGLPGGIVEECADLLIELPGIHEIASRLADIPWAGWPRSFLPEGSATGIPWEEWRAGCGRLYELALGADPSERLAACLQGVCPRLSDLLASKARMRAFLPVLKTINLGGGARTKWPSGDSFDEAKAIAGRLRLEIPSSILTHQFGRLLWPFVEELRALRSEDRSSLTFDDLLYRCHSALARQPGLRDLVSARFGSVLIDEFQDTSGIQVRLFREFLSEGGRIMPGRITVVGDPKQSIYGWRNADIEMFRSTIEDLARGGLRKSISVSMRSTRSIVDFINAFGESLFASVPPGESRFACGYSPLAPRPLAVQGCRVTIALVPRNDDENERRRVEAAWLADRLGREISGAEGKGTWAILFRSLTGVETYLHALSAAGLAWSLDAGRDFVKRPETADLRALLSILLVPSDRTAFLTVLRSPFFAVPDREITTAVAAGLESYLSVPPGVSPHVELACRLLAALRALASEAPPAELLQAIFFRTGFAASIASSGWETGRRFANLRYLYDWCLSSGAVSTADLLDALREKGRGTAAIEDPSTPPSEDCAITIGTIHGAKGLTYPNVVFMGTPRSGHRSDDVVKDEAAGRVGVSFHEGRGTPFLEDVKDSNSQLANAESRRLAYVAVTRAARRLIVLAHQDEASVGGFFARIVRAAALRALEERPDVTESEVIEVLEYPRVPGRALAPVALAPETTSIPGIEPLEAGPPDVEDSPELRLGSAVHSILEKIDFRDPRGWLERNPDDLVLPPGVDRATACRLAMSLFDLEGLPVDLTSVRAEREYPVVTRDGAGKVRELYVDVVAESDGVVHAIDYKTDAVTMKEQIEGAVEAYRPQQTGYGYALSKALGRQVSVWLALLVPGEVRKVADFPPPDPPRAPVRI